MIKLLRKLDELECVIIVEDGIIAIYPPPAELANVQGGPEDYSLNLNYGNISDYELGEWLGYVIDCIKAERDNDAIAMLRGVRLIRHLEERLIERQSKS